jgi:cell division protease FtsH
MSSSALACISTTWPASMHEAMDRSLTILRGKRSTLDRSAHRLLEKETLEEHDLASLLGTSPKKKVAAE